MVYDLLFFLNSILFGIGLAMDAFTVSIANALNEPEMKLKRQIGIASVYGVYQIIMPLAGWVCVHFLAEAFTDFQRFIPWIALILLLFLGIKMIIDTVRGNKNEDNENGSGNSAASLTFGTLMVQGIATSIDALSVGFTISDYTFAGALIETLIIGITTFIICMTGLKLGRVIGTRLNRAGILGGIILIAIGIEIFLKNIL